MEQPLEQPAPAKPRRKKVETVEEDEPAPPASVHQGGALPQAPDAPYQPGPGGGAPPAVKITPPSLIPRPPPAGSALRLPEAQPGLGPRATPYGQPASYQQPPPRQPGALPARQPAAGAQAACPPAASGDRLLRQGSGGGGSSGSGAAAGAAPRPSGELAGGAEAPPGLCAAGCPLMKYRQSH